MKRDRKKSLSFEMKLRVTKAFKDRFYKRKFSVHFVFFCHNQNVNREGFLQLFLCAISLSIGVRKVLREKEDLRLFVNWDINGKFHFH